MRSRITTGLLYSVFELRVPVGGTVTFYREIKLKMGFGVHCYYDKISATHRYRRPQITTGHRDLYTVMEAGVKYLKHQYVKTGGIKYM